MTLNVGQVAAPQDGPRLPPLNGKAKMARKARP
jgi:hypothetical protein